MKLDYNKFEKLLNVYGISSKIEKDNITFYDMETNEVMNGESLVSNSKTTKVSELFNVNNDPFEFNFSISNGKKIFIGEVYYEDNLFTVKQFDYQKEINPNIDDTTSYEHIIANVYENTFYIYEQEYDKTEAGEAINYTADFAYGAGKRDSKKKANKEKYYHIEVVDKLNKKGYQMKFDINNMNMYEEVGFMNKDEAMSLIDSSKVFKKSMDVLCESLSSEYENVKNNTAELKREV